MVVVLKRTSIAASIQSVEKRESNSVWISSTYWVSPSFFLPFHNLLIFLSIIYTIHVKANRALVPVALLEENGNVKNNKSQ